jgi:hypothetical protein
MILLGMADPFPTVGDVKGGAVLQHHVVQLGKV